MVLGAGLGSRLIRAALQMATALSGQGATHRLFADLGGGLRWVSAAPGLVLPGQVSVEELTARFGIPPR